MTAVNTDHPLLIDGEPVETGAWTEVRSPFAGDIVARIAKGGAPEARQALDAAERAMSAPLPAHERARILDATARLLDERQEEAAQIVSAEAGKPLKAARVEAQRAVSTYTFAAVEARKLAGEMVPMDASRRGRRKARIHDALADRDRRRDLAVQLPAEPGGAQDRAGARRRLRGRAQARLHDPAVSALSRAARGRGRPAARLDQRRLGLGRGNRRRARRGRARQADHLHRLRRRRLGNRRTRPSQTRQARARQCDTRDRLQRRTARHRSQARRERLLLRRAELHLRATDLRAAGRLGRLRRRVRAGGGSPPGRRSRRCGHRRRPGDRGERARPHPRLDPSDRRATS